MGRIKKFLSTYGKQEVLTILVLVVLTFGYPIFRTLLKIKWTGIIPIFLWVTLIFDFIVLFILLITLIRKKKTLHKESTLFLIILIMISNFQLNNFQAGNVIVFHKVFLAVSIIISLIELVVFGIVCIESQKEITIINSIFLIFSILQIILLFGSIYSAMYYWDFSSGIEIFKKTVNHCEVILYFDFIYFSTITFTSVGYGDIVPISNMAKAVVMVESLIYPIFIGLIVMNAKKLFTKNV